VLKQLRFPIARDRRRLEIVSHPIASRLNLRPALLEMSCRASCGGCDVHESTVGHRIPRDVVAVQDRTQLEQAVVIYASAENFHIYQYQLSWLIFIGLVVMISACQE
jgi:hypothetical protein